MKILINKDFLKKVTVKENEYECPAELKVDQKHLQDMLDNEVKLCTLVTGYRGVGKSRFIDDTLDKYQNDNPNFLLVKMNVASYADYSVFLKHLIRKIYFAYKKPKNNFFKNDKVYARVESLYIHTFYNVVDYYKRGIQKENGYKLDTTVKNEITGKNVLKTVFEQLPVCIALFGIWYEEQTIAVKFILSIFYMAAKTISVITQMQVWSSSVKNEEKAIEIESLYDDEIAEYQLFQTLEQIKAEAKKRIIFVFDEMDKIEEKKTLKQFLHDMKPLLLSEYGNFILIAGRKMEEYFEKSSEQEDAVISSLFSKKIYISLSSVHEMETFWRGFLEDKAVCDDTLVEKYVNKKIIMSKGVMRKFINIILMDVKWDAEGAPYIEIDENEWKDFDNTLIDVLKMLIERYESSCTEREKDEYLYRLYGWLEYVLSTQNIRIESMISMDASEKVRRQCREFLDELVNCGVLVRDAENDKYVKKGKLKNKEAEEISSEEENIVKEIMRIYDRIAQIILAFGPMCGFLNADYSDEIQQIGVFEDILSDLDAMDVVSINNTIEFVSYYREFCVQGIERDKIGIVRSIASKAEMEIGILTEALLKMLLKQGLQEPYSVQENRVGLHQRSSMFDISIINNETKQVEHAIECKVYRQVMKGTLDTLERTIKVLKSLREEEKPKHLFYLIFVDKNDTERHSMIELEGNEILQSNGVNGNVFVIEWRAFEEKMNKIFTLLR